MKTSFRSCVCISSLANSLQMKEIIARFFQLPLSHRSPAIWGYLLVLLYFGLVYPFLLSCNFSVAISYSMAGYSLVFAENFGVCLLEGFLDKPKFLVEMTCSTGRLGDTRKSRDGTMGLPQFFQIPFTSQRCLALSAQSVWTMSVHFWCRRSWRRS